MTDIFAYGVVKEDRRLRRVNEAHYFFSYSLRAEGPNVVGVMRNYSTNVLWRFLSPPK